MDEEYPLSKSGLDEDREDAERIERRTAESIRRAHLLDTDDCIKRLKEIEHGMVD